MDTPVRVELNLGLWDGLSEEPQTSVISCEVSEVEIGRGHRRWFAHGTVFPASTNGSDEPSSLFRGSLELQSAAAQSAGRQLQDLAEWTRRR